MHVGYSVSAGICMGTVLGNWVGLDVEGLCSSLVLITHDPDNSPNYILKLLCVYETPR